jgi:osmotically-inducible protein OsmY
MDDRWSEDRYRGRDKLFNREGNDQRAAQRESGGVRRDDRWRRPSYADRFGQEEADYGRPPEPMSGRDDFGRFGGDGFRNYGGPREYRDNDNRRFYGEPRPSGSVHDRGDLYEGRRDHRDDYAARGERGWFDRTSDEVSSWFGDHGAEQRRARDAQEDHRGRGPRGYTRSDERIREDVSERLMENPVVDATDIEVAVSGGEVTLSGTVDSRYTRRMAEETAERVLGVTHVQNNVRVRQSPPPASDVANKPYTPPGNMQNNKE